MGEKKKNHLYDQKKAFVFKSCFDFFFFLLEVHKWTWEIQILQTPMGPWWKPLPSSRWHKFPHSAAFLFQMFKNPRWNSQRVSVPSTVYQQGTGGFLITYNALAAVYLPKPRDMLAEAQGPVWQQWNQSDMYRQKPAPSRSLPSVHRPTASQLN